jgi:hypothetical protein
MSVNKKIMSGKMEIKKLNAREEARRFKSSLKRFLLKPWHTYLLQLFIQKVVDFC